MSKQVTGRNMRYFVNSVNADQMLVETRELVKSVRENPKKYLTFKVKVF